MVPRTRRFPLWIKAAAAGCVAGGALAAPLLAQDVAVRAARPEPIEAQSAERLNPMIALHERGLPVFGVTHSAIVARRGRRGGPPGGADPSAAPLPQPVLADAARETLAYGMSDFEYNSYSPASAERFLGYVAALIAAGGSTRDQAGFDAAVADIIAACRELDVPCGYPANNPTDVEKLMGEGHSVFIMQRRNQDGFDAVETGRKLSGRPLHP